MKESLNKACAAIKLSFLSLALMLNSVSVAFAQVDVRGELQKVGNAYQQYLADEKEYLERTQGHLEMVLEQISKQILFPLSKSGATAAGGKEFGEDVDKLTKQLYDSYKFGKAAIADDRIGGANILIKQSLDELVKYLNESGVLGAGATGAIKVGKLGVDGVFDFLYLWQDQIQREELDKRRITLKKLREYWEKYARTHKWEKPSDDSDSSQQVNKDEIKKLLAQLGVEIVMPGEAVSKGSAEISAKTVSGFSLTNVRVTSKNANWMAMNMAGTSLIPANSGSGSQRVGLVSVAIKRSAKAVPETRPIRPAFGMGKPSRSLMTGNAFISKASFSAVASLPARDFPVYLDRNWVLIAPGASVEIPFNSVCLDQGRGTPKADEGFYAAHYTLPSRIQRVLMTAALHNEVPQGKVWGTIGSEGIRWYDPRSMPGLISSIKSGLQVGQFINTFNECRELLSYAPDSSDAILLMGYAYYCLALSGDAANIADTYTESFHYFSKAMDLGQEVTLPVMHHISLGLDQKLSSGLLTLAKGKLKYSSNNDKGYNFAAPLSQVYELRTESNKAGRLHMKVGAATYNFHPAFAGTKRESLYLGSAGQFSYNSLNCPTGCDLALDVFYRLMQREISK